MRCAFVNLGKHFGGAEYYLLTLISRWIEDNNDAVIIAKRGSKFVQKIQNERINANVIEVDYCLKDICSIKETLANLGIDVLNVNGINSGIFTMLVNSGIPKVTTVHSNAELDRINKAWLVRKLFVIAENICLNSSEKVVVVSEAIKELLSKRHIDADKVVLIHNGIKTIEYDARHYYISKDKALNICFVGRLEKIKGCDILIKALQSLNDNNYICDIYGEGSERKKLEQMVHETKLDKTIHFKGFSNDVRELLPNYDLIILPSRYEALPITLLEAMNSKTAIVCSDAGGLPYVIKDGETGFLFNSGDFNDLGERIEWIAKNRDALKAVTENAYREFTEKFTEEKMVQKTFDLLIKTSLPKRYEEEII